MLSELCCAGSACLVVTQPSWCGGIRDPDQCHHSNTEGRPCVWDGKWCTKGRKTAGVNAGQQLSSLVCPAMTTTKVIAPTATIRKLARPPTVPTIKLNTGAHMPMMAFGSGMLPINSVRDFVPRERKNHRSALPHVRMALALNFTHIDTSEVYPGFQDLADVLRPHRERLFVTSKVDPTIRIGRPSATCDADGTGCDVLMLVAANQTRRRLGFAPDLLLLHKPPKRESRNRSDSAAQCRRMQSLWRGLEMAQRRGFAKAIGLSNVCGHLLSCLSRTAAIPPAVLQYMQHVGMGSDPLGYRAYGQRVWNAVPMAYSVLGGANQDFEKIANAPAVVQIAKAHGTHGANVALSWVAQLGYPLVVISSNGEHLADDLHAFDEPPWGRLTKEEMATLSALREPHGRPSYWGDCDDERVVAERPSVELRS